MIPSFNRAKNSSIYSHLIWALLGLLVWVGRQIWQWKQFGSFSFVILLKGTLLLLVAAAAYGFACRRRPGFFWLGFFPLLWIASSKVQWDLCAQPDEHYWIWVTCFILSELVLFSLTDGQKLLPAITPLWVVQAVLFPFSIIQFLSFGWAKNGFFLKNAPWLRYGAPFVGLVVWFFLKGQPLFHFGWYDIYEVFFSDLFISFFLLGLLGMVSFATGKTYWNAAFAPLLLLPLAFLFLSGPDLYSPLRQEILKWMLLFFAGFGWESFRRDVMDRSWHGRLVWVLLGMAFFGGVL